MYVRDIYRMEFEIFQPLVDGRAFGLSAMIIVLVACSLLLVVVLFLNAIVSIEPTTSYGDQHD